MKPEDQERFPPITTTLRDGRTVALRFLAASDATALGTFYESVPREDLRFYLPHPLDRDQAAKKAARADEPGFVCVVAEAAGALVGYAWYQWKEGAGKSGFGLCVRRGWQSAGLGTALTERINEIAATVGPPVMTLTVQVANTRAVALYRAMGFRVVRQGRREKDQARGFAEEPQYWMERRVR